MNGQKTQSRGARGAQSRQGRRVLTLPCRVRARQAGNALITVLIMIGALTPLAAFAVMQARLDLVVHERIRAAMEAFYAAESGLEAALADLRETPTFERLQSGPDGIAGTSDDQLFPFRLPPPPVAGDTALRYEVRVEPRDADTVDVVAEGFAAGNATHTLAAMIKRRGAVVPGAVYVTAPAVNIATGASFSVIGFDRAGREDAQPALVLAREEAAAMARDDLADEASAWRGKGGSPSVGVFDGFAVEAFATAVREDPRTLAIAAEVGGPLGPGILASAGSVDVRAANGSGVLIVNGNLRVSEELTFSGLVVVLGDILFEAGSTVQIAGGLMQGIGRGQLHCLGDGEVAYDSRAIDAVEAQLPNHLPHRAVAVGWRDRS